MIKITCMRHIRLIEAAVDWPLVAADIIHQVGSAERTLPWRLSRWSESAPPWLGRSGLRTDWLLTGWLTNKQRIKLLSASDSPHRVGRSCFFFRSNESYQIWDTIDVKYQDIHIFKYSFSAYERCKLLRLNHECRMHETKELFSTTT